MASGSGDGKIPDLPRGLIDIRGTPAGKARLTSLRNPRDLTLGGAPKRVFVPNINPRKEKTKTEGNELKLDKPKASTSKDKSGKSERGRGRGRGGRGRGRGREEDNFIRVESVFAQGLSIEKSRGQGSKYEYGAGWGGGGGGGSRRREQGKATVSKYPSHDPLDLSDDDKVFNDDDSLDEPDTDLEIVALPDPDRISEEVKKKEASQPAVEAIFKGETEEGIAEASSESVDGCVPEITGDGYVDLSFPTWGNSQNEDDYELNLSPAEVLMKASKSGKEEMFFLHLPHCLPGIPVQRTKQPEPEGSKSKDKENDDQSIPVDRSVHQFSEGYMGKLRVRKSGKVELVLGDIIMEVESGVPLTMLHEVLSVRTDEENKRMTMLGHITHKLIAIPDFEQLVQAAAAENS